MVSTRAKTQARHKVPISGRVPAPIPDETHQASKAVPRETSKQLTKQSPTVGGRPIAPVSVLSTSQVPTATAPESNATPAAAVPTKPTPMTNPSKRTRDSQGREPRKRTRQDFKTTLAVFVGSGKNSQEFTIHKDRICKVSDFFNAACAEHWLEGQTQTVRLPTLPARYFGFYVEWVYSGLVELDEYKEELKEKARPAPQEPQPGEPTTDGAREIAHALCKIWTIADYLGDPACKNKCVAQLATIVATTTDSTPLYLETVEHVATHASVETGLFKLMIDALGKATSMINDRSWLRQQLERLPRIVRDELLSQTLLEVDVDEFSHAGKDAKHYME